MVAILAAGFFMRKDHQGWAFVTTAVTIAFSLVTAFLIMFPRVMISTIDPSFQPDDL